MSLQPYSLTKAEKFYISRLQIPSTNNIVYLEKFLKDLYVSLNDITDRYNAMKEIDLMRLASEDAESFLWSEKKVILQKQLEIALEKNTEFNHPLFIKQLDEVIASDLLYNLDIDYRSGTVFVRLEMNRVAGDLSEYAESVEAARAALGIGKMPTEKGGGNRAQAEGDVTASTFWRDKIYRPAREGGSDTISREGTKRDVSSKYSGAWEETIQARIMSFSNPAPFWQILDQGTLPFPEDVGGVRYPKNSRTNFVARAERQIKSAFEKRAKKQYSSIKRSFDRLAIEYRTVISILEDIIRDVQDLITVLRWHGGGLPPKKPPTGGVGVPTKFQRMRMKLMKLMTADERRRADQSKVDYWASQLATGGDIPREKIGFGGGVRHRIRSLIED